VSVPKTLLGVGSYAFAWSIGVPGYPAPSQPMDARAFVVRAADLGVRRAQIADNLPLERLSSAELDALERLARELGIAVEVGTRGIAPVHLRAFLALARRFGSPIVRVVVDTAAHHPDPPEIVETLRGVLPDFAAADVILAIENHDRFKARTLADIVMALDSPHVGICLDTVNSFGALEGPDVVIETLGRFVVNLHVKDFSIRRADHNMGFVLTGTPAGAGMLDVPRVLERLYAHGRTFSAILEQWLAPDATVDATIGTMPARESAWAVESVRYLRTLLEE
jgi:sugar phosphate isomerase/epimerase